MYRQVIRWPTLICVAVLFGMAHLASETGALWFGFPARPDWIYLVAFVCTLRASPVAAVTAFACCGLVRDLVLGPKLGAAVIAYILVGWSTTAWRTLAANQGVLATTLSAGITAFVASLIKHSLDYGMQTHKLIDRIFFIAVGDGLLSGVAYLPLVFLLGIEALKPWQERDGY